MTTYIKHPEQLKHDFQICFDDREKKPWMYLEKSYGPMKKKRLTIGDYTIRNLESLIAIEKKSGIGELLSDLTTGYRPTFKRFLTQLSRVPIRCIVVESELNKSDIEYQLAVLAKHSNGRCKMTPMTIYYWVAEITNVYGIPMVFANKRTIRQLLPSVFESAYKKAMEIQNG